MKKKKIFLSKNLSNLPVYLSAYSLMDGEKDEKNNTQETFDSYGCYNSKMSLCHGAFKPISKLIEDGKTITVF